MYGAGLSVCGELRASLFRYWVGKNYSHNHLMIDKCIGLWEASNPIRSPQFKRVLTSCELMEEAFLIKIRTH